MTQRTNPGQSNDDESLRQELERAKSIAERLSKMGSQLQKQGTEIRDWVDLSSRGFSVASSAWDRKPATEYLKRMNNSLERNYLGPMTTVLSGETAYYGMASITGMLIPFTEPNVQQLPPHKQEEARDIQTAWHDLARRSGLREQTLESYCFLGLDKTSRGKFAMQQFDSAWEIHLQMPSSPTSSLIPMREAIDVSLGELLRMRPHQEESKPNKIIKLLGQVRAVYVPEVEMWRLQDRYTEVHDRLSAAKGNVIMRSEENTLMVEATLFLNQLLKAIDPAKLRK